DVASLRALGPLLDVERDLITLVEGPEAICLDGGEVDEDVVPAFILGDEAVTLLAAEPFDLAFCHDLPYLPGGCSGASLGLPGVVGYDETREQRTTCASIAADGAVRDRLPSQPDARSVGQTRLWLQHLLGTGLGG